MQRFSRSRHSECNRTLVMTFRMTKTEREQLQAKAANMDISVSDYLRLQALNGNAAVSDVDKLVLPAEIVLELRRIGVNLNQIAKAANAGLGIPPHLSRLIKRLDDIVMYHIEKDLPDW